MFTDFVTFTSIVIFVVAFFRMFKTHFVTIVSTIASCSSEVDSPFSFKMEHGVHVDLRVLQRLTVLVQ